MINSVLFAANVCKTYKQGSSEISVLNDLTLDIKPGEIVAVVGRSGSGKSTLLNVLAGLDSLDRGEVMLSGNCWSDLNEREKDNLRNAQLGFVYQFHHLLPEFNAVENVTMPARIGGLNIREATAKAMKLLKSVGLEDRASHFPNELSGGERQRVAIARALVNKPAIVLMDEPTGNLDEASRESVLNVVRDLAHSNQQSFVIVTHDQYVASVADRVLTLDKGQLTE